MSIDKIDPPTGKSPDPAEAFRDELFAEKKAKIKPLQPGLKMHVTPEDVFKGRTMTPKTQEILKDLNPLGLPSIEVEILRPPQREQNTIPKFQPLPLEKGNRE